MDLYLLVAAEATAKMLSRATKTFMTQEYRITTEGPRSWSALYIGADKTADKKASDRNPIIRFFSWFRNQSRSLRVKSASIRPKMLSLFGLEMA